ncbi:MAG: dihydrolipoyl dehydrogenase [Euryarchaeota archaeon RBG_19FT_COMBO_56_21]|nr:MAG: dihydrolipoyl dehydrogenase [Euryarchaeota archaeon RBG_19FT_COMBO_56_21]
MKEYGLIVIGTGAGMNVVDVALQRGLRVALVEEGPLGGTCLNRGCIPSKVLVHAADSIREAEAAEKAGVSLRVEKTDYALIKKRMWDIVLTGRHELENGVKSVREIDLYTSIGSFVSDYTMQVGGETIKAPRIVIASGARAQIPPVPGLDKVKYHTYRTVFNIEERPESIVILGGGYIGCEFAHFFSAIGTKVTLVGRNPVLLPHEEPETSALVKKRLSSHVEVHTATDTLGVEGRDGMISVTIRDPQSGVKTVDSQHLLVATGVQSNSDWVKPEKTGVNTDDKGWIRTNQFLETSKPNIYALGDALGRNMYRHTANYEASIVRYNMFAEKKVTVDLHAVPHAVFTDPQVGQVGMTENDARIGRKIMVGFSRFYDTAMGYAYADEEAFVKVIVESPSRKILGATVAGPQASILVQQVVNLMNSEAQTYMPLARAQIIHPTLTEALASAFGALKPVNFEPEPHRHEHTQKDG